MTLGERIKKARKNQGLTQEELANNTGVSLSAIIKYENNQREPRIEMLIKIADTLKNPIESLIYDNYKPIESNIEKEILLKAINTFGANQQIIKAMEELGELSTALARYFDKNKIDVKNICEEIADVEIMISQLRLIFSSASVDDWKKKKLERLKGVVW